MYCVYNAIIPIQCVDKYSVTLVDKMTGGGTDILDSLEISFNTSPVSSASFDSLPTSPLSPVAIPMRSLPLNKKIRLMCTDADSPNHFRCQVRYAQSSDIIRLVQMLTKI